MEPVFIFDMDGVVIDSVPLLYDVYRRFLKGFGITVDDEECKILNGKNLHEIIAYIKATHHLRHDAGALLARYHREMRAAYAKAPLTPGVIRSLQWLQRHRFRIALASASKRTNIDYIVRKYKLRKYFDMMVSGDEVAHAKPSPEIYQLVRARFGKHHEYYVLEDSDHGVASALAARMRVIRFDPLKRSAPQPTVETVSRMPDLSRIIDGVHAPCRMIASHHTIEARIAPHRLFLSPQQERASQTLWTRATARNPSLFDGTIIGYLSHHVGRNKLVIECVRTTYKYFLAQLQEPALRLPVFPLTVGGVIVDEHDNTLVGRRAGTVTEYPGWYEFVPSGGISADKDKIERKRVLFNKQLEEEFTEEVGLPVARISAIEPFSLVLDAQHQLYVIGCTIRLTGDLTAIRPRRRRAEHDALHVIHRTALHRFMESHRMIPTSRLIAERIAR